MVYCDLFSFYGILYYNFIYDIFLTLFVILCCSVQAINGSYERNEGNVVQRLQIKCCANKRHTSVVKDRNPLSPFLTYSAICSII